jgi:hypothetical protein
MTTDVKSRGAKGKSPPAKGVNAGLKDALLNEVAKATGVSKTDSAKVLDHLGLGEKLSRLDAKVAKQAIKEVAATDLKIAIKLGKDLVVI